MISTQDIIDKEIINIYDGKSLGFADDVEVNIEKGQVEGLIIYGRQGFLRILKGEDDQFIPWREVRRIGDDVILAEVFSGTTESGWDLRAKDKDLSRETEEAKPEKEEDVLA